MKDTSLVVTIDGPAGAGKSTVARLVAGRLGISYLDTGALYRTLALFLHSVGVPPMEGDALKHALSRLSVNIAGNAVWLNGIDVGLEIRSPHVDSIVSHYAALPSVRANLLFIQREQGRNHGIVADGRDMGTVVFPDAAVKIFLTASDEERARRRLLELRERGEDVPFDEVLRVIRERDKIDSERASAPLRKADDAIELCTDGLSIEEVVDVVLAVVAKNVRKASLQNDSVQ